MITTTAAYSAKIRHVSARGSPLRLIRISLLRLCIQTGRRNKQSVSILLQEIRGIRRKPNICSGGVISTPSSVAEPTILALVNNNITKVLFLIVCRRGKNEAIVIYTPTGILSGMGWRLLV